MRALTEAVLRARRDGSFVDGKVMMETVKFKDYDSLHAGSSILVGAEGDLTTFTSTVAGTGKDNPQTAEILGPEFCQGNENRVCTDGSTPTREEEACADGTMTEYARCRQASKSVSAKWLVRTSPAPCPNEAAL